MTGTLVFYSEFDNFDQLKRLLLSEIPTLDIQQASAVTAPEKVRYALVWKPPEHFFQRWPNLELVINLGAGVDALVGRRDLSDIPVTRLSDPNMARMMAGYVLFAVLRYARDIPFFEQMQKQDAEYPQIWHLFAYLPATEHLARFTQEVIRGPAPLSPGLRELIAAYTSQRNHCPF